MTDTVEAQWALQGKTLGREGYRVLACSTGSLNQENFTDLIRRFSMGTPETLPNALPQVTISYLKHGPVNHLALAIHRLASDARFDGQLTTSDDDGRPVVATSYYCVPYAPVAQRSVSYKGMYQAFAAVTLRPVNGPVLPVEMTVAPVAPDPGAIDPLAIQAAALLLTGRPVCVLGATLQTSMTDRLGFIDTVMSLLPYGFRARMTAATWTRATNQNHRFRLFFSGARRDTEDPDNVVFWGNPEQTTVERGDTYAHDYFNWLNRGPVADKLSLLAGLTQPRSLANQQEVLEALDTVDKAIPVSMPRLWRKPSFIPKAETEPDPKQEGSENGSAPTEGATAAARSEIELLLMDCNRYMEGVDPRRLSDAIGRLKRHTRHGVEPGERDCCGKLIRELRLFRHSEATGKDEDALREILLKIAFEPPLSYEDYCLIEDGTGEIEDEEGKPKDLDPSLLQLIEKQGAADHRVKAITYRQLPSGDGGKKLSKWYSSKDLDAYLLINLLALDVKRPRHMRLLCEVTTDYLRKMSKTHDPKDIDRALRQHSYLAGKLQDSMPGDDQYQLETLGTFLRAAYPNELTRQDLYHVLIGTNEPVTPPFLGAVLLMVANDADACLARELYVYYLFLTMNFETSTRRELVKLVAIPERPAPGSQPEAPPFERKFSGPLPPHDASRGDPARQPSADAPAALSDGQRPDPGKYRAGMPRGEQ